MNFQKRRLDRYLSRPAFSSTSSFGNGRSHIKKILLIVTALASILAAATKVFADSPVTNALNQASQVIDSPNVLGPLNDAITTMLRTAGLSDRQATRIVPIIGYESAGATMRLAQISGAQSAIDKVRAVLEIDDDHDEGSGQFTALVPVSSIAKNGRGHRVDGVGIAAIITR